MNQIKVGDQVKTRKGYVGKVLKIYDDGKVLLEVGPGKLYGCCIQACKKVEEPMKRFNLFLDGVYLETIEAKNYEDAYRYGEAKYHALDDDLLEVEEVEDK